MQPNDRRLAPANIPRSGPKKVQTAECRNSVVLGLPQRMRVADDADHMSRPYSMRHSQQAASSRIADLGAGRSESPLSAFIVDNVLDVTSVSKGSLLPFAA